MVLLRNRSNIIIQAKSARFSQSSSATQYSIVVRLDEHSSLNTYKVLVVLSSCRLVCRACVCRGVCACVRACVVCVCVCVVLCRVLSNTKANFNEVVTWLNELYLIFILSYLKLWCEESTYVAYIYVLFYCVLPPCIPIPLCPSGSYIPILPCLYFQRTIFFCFEVHKVSKIFFLLKGMSFLELYRFHASWLVRRFYKPSRSHKLVLNEELSLITDGFDFSCAPKTLGLNKPLSICSTTCRWKI